VTRKAVVPRKRAARDVDDALDYYLNQASEKVAMGFVDELERAYAHLSRFPESGSNRYAFELNLPGLRAWPVSSYPYLIFYVPTPDYVDVWRVLHARRDIPSWMAEA
jgi:toxin ParE1/3/4